MTAEVYSAVAQADQGRSPDAVAHPRGGMGAAVTPATPSVHRRERGADPMRDNPEVMDLVTRAGKGDKQAWDALVERYVPLMWSICRRHRLGDADAEDVSRRVWLQLMDQLHSIRDPAALPGWLATTTRRECLRVLGAARGPLAAGFALDAEALPDGQAGAAERHAALREAFDALPPAGQRLLLLLLEHPPVPDAEISARLGVPVGSIRPARSCSLEELRRHPAIAALINADRCPADDRHG
jgi:RNA polymerase sigma factor (sigma-70 family)